jgi:hypothetical protein
MTAPAAANRPYTQLKSLSDILQAAGKSQNGVRKYRVYWKLMELREKLKIVFAGPALNKPPRVLLGFFRECNLFLF